MKINFIESGNGYPETGDILVCREDCTAYRVLESEPGTSDGQISTGQAGQHNECQLAVRAIDYEDYFDYEDAWEI